MLSISDRKSLKICETFAFKWVDDGLSLIERGKCERNIQLDLQHKDSDCGFIHPVFVIKNPTFITPHPRDFIIICLAQTGLALLRETLG